jgi:thiol-disulfide isomerase/thioredoxin
MKFVKIAQILITVFLLLALTGFLLTKFKKTGSMGVTTDKSTTDITVYLFKAKWCSHCTKFLPDFEKFEKESKDKKMSLKFVVVDADDESTKDLVKKYKVDSYPTIIFVKDSVEHVYSGERTINGLMEFVKTL